MLSGFFYAFPRKSADKKANSTRANFTFSTGIQNLLKRDLRARQKFVTNCNIQLNGEP